MEPSPNANPIPTPSNMPIPDATKTPSATLNPIPVSGNLNVFIWEVVHIDNGTQTMVKILFPEKLEGAFFAIVENLWSEYDYQCFILGESNQDLFCLGANLRPVTQANIRVYKDDASSEDSTLVFSDSFEVPVLILQPTNTVVPSAVPPLTFTSTPTNTNTSMPINTPQPTNTPKPTNTPRPTHTPKPNR
jgi:hypothetical protein